MNDLNPVLRLTKDLKQASTTLGKNEARFLVDAYYQMQNDRIRADGQVRSLSKDEEPHAILNWLGDQSRTLENQIKRALDTYSTSLPLGVWARGVRGIGPVITAGLLAHIDITKAPTVGHIWSFAGLDPTKKWEKKTKRPWNASLKVICWKIGESFVKIKGHPEGFYGHIYDERKTYEVQKNFDGDYANQAKTVLETKRIGKETDAYKAYIIGQLPLGHIHARAKRYAVKLFLSHYHETAYWLHYDQAPPLPYPIAILGHAHKIERPN